MSRHDDSVRLRHMLEHAGEAVGFIEGREPSDLKSDRMLELALCRLAGVIGEAASRVSPEGRGKIPELSWSDIIGMRHRIIHGYDMVAHKVLWSTITKDLPPLIRILREHLEPCDPAH